ADQDLVRRRRGEVGAQRVEHLGAMFMAPLALPRQIAEGALAQPFARGQRGRGAQVQIGEMGERVDGCGVRARFAAHGAPAALATWSAKAAMMRAIWASLCAALRLQRSRLAPVGEAGGTTRFT